MKKITTILMLLMLSMGAWAQDYSIVENSANRQHITDPGNLADGDVIMLQATEQTQKYFGGPNHTTDGTDDSYWKLVASGSSYKLVKLISTATGATPVYLKAPTAQGQDPIQTTNVEDDAALLTFSTPATNYIRFTAKVNNSGADTYLNCNSSNSTVKWATGTGGWSYWKVFKTDATLIEVTQEQSEAYDKVQSWLPLIQNSHALVTDASNYVSNARQQDSEGLYTSLLDKNNATYFHSAWGGSGASVPDHDLQARLPEAVNSFYLFYVTRANGTGYPQAMRIDGSNNASDFSEAGGTGWTNSVASLSSLPSGATKTYLSDKISMNDAYQYLRFVPDVSYKDTYWFCLAEFWLFPSNAAIDAAITMMKSVNAAYEITAEMISQINQIDEDLRNTTANVTYVVKDESGTTLFTSEPQSVAKGTTVTTLPEEFQRPAFYTYNTVSETVNENKAVEFTATLKTDAPVKFTEDTTNPYYYNLTIRSKYIIRQSDNTVRNQTESSPFNPAASWAFIGNPYSGFRVINQGAGDNFFLMYDEIRIPRHSVECVTLRENDTKTWILDTNSNGFVLHATENPSVYLHQRTDNGLSTCSVTEWGSVHNDAGSTIVASTDKDVLVQLYNLLKTAPIGEGVNQYSATGVNPEEILANAATVIDNEESSQYYATYNALLDLQSAMTLNMPQAGMYRIKGKTSGKYLAAGLASNGKFNMTDALDATTIFYFDGTKLVNYSDGKVNGMTTGSWAWVYENGAVSTVVYEDGNTNGGYAMKSATAYFYDNGDGSASADRGQSNNGNVRYNDWYLEAVTQLPITLRSTDGTNYFATFSAPVNVQISGASLNEVTNNNKTAAYNTVDTDMLKAGVGVLLSGTSATATATIITEDVAEADYGLVKYYAATAGTGDESKLYLGKGKTSGKPGFYKLGEGTTSNGFKAYLSNSTEFGGAKEGFELEFAGVTGIENMENGTLNMENGAVYNLQGQRVNKAQKGVFIQNGKKVVLK